VQKENHLRSLSKDGLLFGTSGDMGLFEKVSNNNGLRAVGKLKLHHKQMNRQ